MTWPFDHGGVVLALYLATLALHFAFIGYVVAGTGYVLVQALRRRADAVADTVRDRLPFMLGAAITAGVAPLLFVQLLYQRRFYTANLIAGPRWLAIVPALIAGFYALYLAKATARGRRAMLAFALACFAFVAWSWSELHRLMLADEARWRDMYAAGTRVFVDAALPPRALAIAGAMTTMFATIAAWSTGAGPRRTLAALALAGRAVSLAGALWLAAPGVALAGPASIWLGALIAAAAVEAAAWLGVRRAGSDRALAVATAAGTAALLAALVVREAPRLALLEPSPVEHGGAIVFALTAAVAIAAIGWVVRVARA